MSTFFSVIYRNHSILSGHLIQAADQPRHGRRHIKALQCWARSGLARSVSSDQTLHEHCSVAARSEQFQEPFNRPSMAQSLN